MISQFQIGMKTYYEKSQRRTKLKNFRIVKHLFLGTKTFSKSLKIQNLLIYLYSSRQGVIVTEEGGCPPGKFSQQIPLFFFKSLS